MSRMSIIHIRQASSAQALLYCTTVDFSNSTRHTDYVPFLCLQYNSSTPSICIHNGDCFRLSNNSIMPDKNEAMWGEPCWLGRETCGQEIDRPALLHPLVQGFEQCPSQQVLNISWSCLCHRNILEDTLNAQTNDFCKVLNWMHNPTCPVLVSLHTFFSERVKHVEKRFVLPL